MLPWRVWGAAPKALGVAPKQRTVEHLCPLVSAIAAAALVGCAGPKEGTKAMPTPSTLRASNSTQPEALHRALADAFNRRDLDDLLSLYDENATLVPQPGTDVAGAEAI